MTGNTSNPSPGDVPPRSGCLTAFMVLIGIVLLLPGLCALVFTAASLNDPYVSSFLPLIAVCLAVAFGGIMMIRAAVRGPKR